ncbi:alpha/beta hydrolase [Kribbella deserti]|uniref:Alpha/beta hydrolase n=1 Tax=Kribbella deserti TaxID=1926257 RepID=A0ABV6QQR2_9ACTN
MTVDADPAPPGILQRYLDQPITWSVCAFDGDVKQTYPQAPTTMCATVKVPMDWHNPDAHSDIRLSIAHSQALGASKGLLTANPGGPGSAGVFMPAYLASYKPQMFHDFDLVGFDPRGFGGSERLRCLTTAEKLNNLPVTADYKRRDQQTHLAEVAEAELLAEACAATEFGQFVSSQQTVYDMEFLRALVAKPKLSFIGVSYGTWLGGWYADTYPTKVGRFILDSNMDWTHTHWENMSMDPMSGQRRRDSQLLPWLARHADDIEGLGATPAEVSAKYETIRARLVQMVDAGTSSVRGDSLDMMIYGDTYGNVRFVRAAIDILVHDEYVKGPGTTGKVALIHVDNAWSRIGRTLQRYDSLSAIRARYGVVPVNAETAAASQLTTRNTLLTKAREQAAKAVAPSQQINLGSFGMTVRCNDSRWSKNVQYYLDEADRMTSAYPFAGYLNGVPMCAFWNHEPQDRVADLQNAPQVLMLQSELDPATAYEGGLRTHRAISPHSRFVAVDDEGHHSLYFGVPASCIQDVGDSFLFNGELPNADVVCGTVPLPGDAVVYPVAGPVDQSVATTSSSQNVFGSSPLLQQVMDANANHLVR